MKSYEVMLLAHRVKTATSRIKPDRQKRPPHADILGSNFSPLPPGNAGLRIYELDHGPSGKARSNSRASMQQHIPFARPHGPSVEAADAAEKKTKQSGLRSLTG
jgi:hypothetical protein